MGNELLISYNEHDKASVKIEHSEVIKSLIRWMKNHRKFKRYKKIINDDEGYFEFILKDYFRDINIHSWTYKSNTYNELRNEFLTTTGVHNSKLN